jgi:hypothetical protein
MTTDDGFQSVGEIQAGVLKDITICAELRFRLKAELGRAPTDEEVVAVARASGVRL